MNTARLVFTTTRGAASAVIRAGTWSRWSHVALVDDFTVIEATAKHGVRRAPLGELIAHASRFALVDLPCVDPAAAIAAAASQIGKPYDWSGAFGVGLHRDWQEDDAWFCSELVAWAFEVTQQPLLRAEVVRRVTPQHLWMLPPSPGAALHAPALSLSTLTS